MQGGLLTRDFLLEGIKDIDAWIALGDGAVEAFRVSAHATFEAFRANAAPNESQTEQDLIYPILRALGWEHFLTQQAATKRREDVPDVLLFADAAAKNRAGREKGRGRYRHGLVVVENKAWGMPLDRGPPDLFNQNAPSTQMLRYLTRVEIESDGAVQWGILTNGRVWRLYYQRARSRAEEFLELDLALLLEAPGIPPELFSDEVGHRADLLRAFLLLFRRDSFLPSPEDARTFHEIARERSREWEARVRTDLSNDVFDYIFPELLKVLAAADPAAPKPLDPAYLDEVRRAALVLLYRLLFVFFAEDRNLLPVRDPRYDDYSAHKLRQELAQRVDRRDPFSAQAATIYQRLKTTFGLIDTGDSSIGLPPYNGGLFEGGQHPLLDRAAPPDSALAPLLDRLSRRQEGDRRKWINYRDLTVQHLGSIYERLIEHEVVAEGGAIAVRPNPFARKGSGSYYTPEDLVHLILDRTIGPLIEERRAAFRERAEALRHERTPKAERLKALAALDPANGIVELKICDPAMGSGHFLVSLVDYLADAILEAMQEASDEVDWTDAPYVSPLATRLGAIRERILAAADREHWPIDRNQLDDRHIVRRMILKRCVYGVDKNPMAVELAKVALWLHTFTAGAPLSFLDHHLRCGDSLFGEWVGPAMTETKGALLVNRYVQQAKRATQAMLTIEEATDADVAEVRRSSETFAAVGEDTGGLTRFLDLVHALRWLDLDDAARRVTLALLDGQYGDVVKLLGDSARAEDLSEANGQAVRDLIGRTRDLAMRERFLHWEVAFPGVWRDWESNEPKGGFDAVIGNPPWDRIKLQEVEWFALRRPEIAMAQRAADRKKMIAALQKKGDPLWRDYVAARERAERMADVARTGRHYPLLSKGDINIYSLFVERAQRLIKPDGIVGLLVPSGIAADKSASEFFKSVATTGRLSALIDFENRGVFFPDVHQQFRFCTMVYGGVKRRFEGADCVFLRRSTLDLSKATFRLAPQDFQTVNPNTGTVPMFRNRRDAEIALGIYRRLPVLVRHTAGGEKGVWPVRYFTMFHMTNDSGLFRTREELEAEGFYAVAGRPRLKKGRAEAVPLYVGKMIHQFDHRSASVSVSDEALHVAASSDLTTEAQHRDPGYYPSPQFWVPTDDMRERWPDGLEWLVGFRDITNATNARTVIAAIVPFCAAGNTLPLLLPIGRDEAAAYRSFAPLLVANLNALVLDYVARQKVQGTHLNWYIAEQLPVVPRQVFEQRIGKTKIADFVRGEVLRLTYTARDLAPFARDLGHDGDPFPWDEDDRRHRRARLDALFFGLYGIGPDDAAYILDTFPIVKEQDEAAFGRYLTKDLVLGYMRALEAGDLTVRIAV